MHQVPNDQIPPDIQNPGFAALGRRVADQGVFSGHPAIKMFAQFGFAELVALLFYQQFQNQAEISQSQTRERSVIGEAQTRQIADMIVANDLRAKEDRQQIVAQMERQQTLFREENKYQRDESKIFRDDLRAATAAMLEATKAIVSGARTLERTAETLPKER